MNVIDLLEKRIEALELKILSKDNSLNLKTQSITDLLLHIQTMISLALTCRDAITSILQHTTTINEYFELCNGESGLEVKAKRLYLLEFYPDLQDTVQLMGTFENLVPVTDSNITKLTELSVKLDQLAEVNLATYEENREAIQNVLKTLQQYKEIAGAIRILFTQMDQAIEVALQPKFVGEE